MLQAKLSDFGLHKRARYTADHSSLMPVSHFWGQYGMGSLRSGNAFGSVHGSAYGALAGGGGSGSAGPSMHNGEPGGYEKSYYGGQAFYDK